MRIYKLYLRVKQEEYDSFFHLIIPNWYYYDFYEKDNRFIGLYAWTDSKEILYQFFEFRKLKRFWIDKVKMSKKEFETFRVDQKEFQLVEEEIYDETFILPIHERETICNTGSEMLAEYIQIYGDRLRSSGHPDHADRVRRLKWPCTRSVRQYSD